MKELSGVLAEQWNSQPGSVLLYALITMALLSVLCISLLVMVIILARRQSRLLRGTTGGNLETALRQQMDSAEEMERQVDRSMRLGLTNAEELRACLQKVGVVRYDAFADIGGEQSFTVALLDGGGNGVLLTSIHSRNDVRVYAKPVIGNDSPVALTEEERRAITTAAPGASAVSLPGRGGRERK